MTTTMDGARAPPTPSSSWILDAYGALEPRSYLREHTSRGVRPDGRTLSSSRPVSALPSVLTRNSRGSALIALGGGGGGGGGSGSGGGGAAAAMAATRVVAACTLLVGRPSPATPDEGDVDVTLAASPLSGPRFDVAGREASGGGTEGGRHSTSCGSGDGDGDRHRDEGSRRLPGNLSDVVSRTHGVYSDLLGDRRPPDVSAPSADVKEIESWIRRVLRSSGYVNPRDLGIVSGDSAWRVRVSIHILNHEGNVRDAALIAACAALRDLRIPPVEVSRDGADGGGACCVRIATSDNTDASSSSSVAAGGGGGGTGGTKSTRRRGGRSLNLGPLPAPLTVAILPNAGKRDGGGGGGRRNLLAADPTRLEEDASGGNYVTAVCNTRGEVVEFQKCGSGSRLSAGEMSAVVSMGFGRAEELEGLLRLACRSRGGGQRRRQ